MHEPSNDTVKVRRSGTPNIETIKTNSWEITVGIRCLIYPTACLWMLEAIFQGYVKIDYHEHFYSNLKITRRYYFLCPGL